MYLHLKAMFEHLRDYTAWKSICCFLLNTFFFNSLGAKKLLAGLCSQQICLIFNAITISAQPNSPNIYPSVSPLNYLHKTPPVPSPNITWTQILTQWCFSRGPLFHPQTLSVLQHWNAVLPHETMSFQFSAVAIIWTINWSY